MDDTDGTGELAGATEEAPTDLSGTIVDTIEADEVRVHQGGVNRVFAGVVEMDTGGAITVDAETVGMTNSVGVVIRADVVEANDSGGGVVAAREVHLTNSRLGLTVAERADLQQSSTVVLLAREVHGPVETLLDTRGAIVAGLVAGATAGLLGLAGALLRRTRS